MESEIPYRLPLPSISDPAQELQIQGHHSAIFVKIIREAGIRPVVSRTRVVTEAINGGLYNQIN